MRRLQQRHSGMKVCCISCVSNLASGMTQNKLEMEEVIEAANQIEGVFTFLV